MKRLTFIFLAVFLIFTLPNCEKDVPNNENDSTDTISDATKSINNWIWYWMNKVYLWVEYIPKNLDPNKEPDPEAFFEKLLYTKDRFSWIYDDYEGLMAQYYGVAKSTGYSPVFGQFSSTGDVFIIVEYVFPGSPADSAGLKRGDIILEINGIGLNTDNYLSFYNLESQTVTLGHYDGTSIYLTDTKISMIAKVIALDPAIYYEIKEIGGHKIGYLVYVEFTSGKDNEYLASLGEIFDTLSVAGITDLIIDLRYNPGGDIGAAGFLASAIAPASIVQNHEVLVRFEYNSLYNKYFLDNEGSESDNLIYRFPVNSHNLNLNQVYFLTTGGTASACEFVISGLEPYMAVILIGENTYGKYTGAWIISDVNTPRRHNWALVPTVMKYANAEGYTDFDDGLPVDVEVEDNIINAVPFGDLSDPVLNKAVESIVGPPQMPSTKKFVQPVPFKQLDNRIKEPKRNLFTSPFVLSK